MLRQFRNARTNDQHTHTHTYEPTNRMIINLLVRRGARALSPNSSLRERIPRVLLLRGKHKHTHTLTRSLSLVVHVVRRRRALRNLRIPSSTCPFPRILLETRASSTHTHTLAMHTAQHHTRSTTRIHKQPFGGYDSKWDHKLYRYRQPPHIHTHTRTALYMCVLLSTFFFLLLLTIWRCDFVIEPSFAVFRVLCIRKLFNDFTIGCVCVFVGGVRSTL